MKLYLAGPMRGIPQFNFPAFEEAAARLRGWDYEIWSPHEADLAAGEKADGPFLGMRHYMKRDMLPLLECDGVALLPGWQNSTGALIESFVMRMIDGPLMSAIDLAPIDLTEHAVAVVKKLGLNAWIVT